MAAKGRGKKVADGLYRLIKFEEDDNPVFPSKETVVEVKGEDIINLSTHRRCQLNGLGAARALFGPIQTPYDVTPLDKLNRIDLGHSEESDAQGNSEEATSSPSST